MPKDGKNKYTFVDLGHGSGKGILTACLLYPFKKCMGIELLDKLYEASNTLKYKYKTAMEDLITTFG